MWNQNSAAHKVLGITCEMNDTPQSLGLGWLFLKAITHLAEGWPP
jgi:hypothetical protein